MKNMKLVTLRGGKMHQTSESSAVTGQFTRNVNYLYVKDDA